MTAGELPEDRQRAVLGRPMPLLALSEDLDLRGPAAGQVLLSRRLRPARVALAGGHVRLSAGPGTGFALDVSLPPFDAATGWREDRSVSWPAGQAEARLLRSATAAPRGDGTDFRGRLVSPAPGGCIDVAGMLSLSGGVPELAVFRVALCATGVDGTLVLTARAVLDPAAHDLRPTGASSRARLVLQVRAAFPGPV